MKKLLGFVMLLLLGSGTGLAQFTTVSATIVDSDTTTWAAAPYSWSFQPGPNQSNPANYTYNGAALASFSGSGAANGSGVISISGAIYDVTLIRPIGASYNITVCPNASSKCSTVNFAPSGGSMSLSTQINAVISAPRFAALSGSYGYIDGETIPQLHPGSIYWNVTSSINRCYSGSTWASCSGSGSGTVSGQAVNVIGKATNATTTGAQSALSDDAINVTSSEPIIITGSTHGITIPAGTASSGVANSVVYASDATNGYAEVNENNTGLSRVCTVGNGICAGGGGTGYTHQTAYNSGTRVWGTVYHNTQITNMQVTVYADLTATAAVGCYSDSATTPTTLMTAMFASSVEVGESVTFNVLAGNYYKCTQLAGSAGFGAWVEWY
jgi:hypothetical protein